MTAFLFLYWLARAGTSEVRPAIDCALVAGLHVFIAFRALIEKGKTHDDGPKEGRMTLMQLSLVRLFTRLCLLY